MPFFSLVVGGPVMGDKAPKDKDKQKKIDDKKKATSKGAKATPPKK